MNYDSDLLNFINSSPTMFQAVDQTEKRLVEAGFTKLDLRKKWQLDSRDYYITFNDSALIAFRLGQDDQGFKLIGAHTDSPLLKLKPSPTINSQGYTKLNVEIYGGPLVESWFDRPLSLAGRVVLDDTAF